MCNLSNKLSCISIPKSCKPKLYGNLDDRADLCTVCHVLEKLMIDIITSPLKVLSVMHADRFH